MGSKASNIITEQQKRIENEARQEAEESRASDIEIKEQGTGAPNLPGESGKKESEQKQPAHTTQQQTGGLSEEERRQQEEARRRAENEAARKADMPEKSSVAQLRESFSTQSPTMVQRNEDLFENLIGKEIQSFLSPQVKRNENPLPQPTAYEGGGVSQRGDFDNQLSDNDYQPYRPSEEVSQEEAEETEEQREQRRQAERERSEETIKANKVRAKSVAESRSRSIREKAFSQANAALHYVKQNVKNWTTTESLAAHKKQYAQSAARAREQFLTEMKNKTYTGHTFYDTLQSDPNVPFNSFAIGTDNVRESIRQPDSAFLPLFNLKRKQALEGGEEWAWLNGGEFLPMFTDENGNPVEEVTVDMALDNMDLFCAEFNQLNIYGTISKDPVNKPGDIHRTRILIFPGRGLRCHPLALKMSNGDFDSDKGSVNINQRKLASSYSFTTDLFFDNEHNLMIDLDFFGKMPVPDDVDESDIAKLLVKSRYFGKNLLPDRIVRKISEAYLEWSNFVETEGSSVSEQDMYEGLINAIIDAGDYLARKHSKQMRRAYGKKMPKWRFHQLRDEYISNVFQTMYLFNTTRHDLAVADQVGKMSFLEVSHSNFTLSEDNREKLPPFLEDITEEMDKRMMSEMIIAGEGAISWPDFLIHYNRYYGMYSKKNVAFRDVANWLKQLNRTDLINNGDPNLGLKPLREIYGEDDMVTVKDLFKLTCAMQTAMKFAGKSALGTEEVNVAAIARKNVLEAVGSPSDYLVRTDGWNDPTRSIDDEVKWRMKQNTDAGVPDEKNSYDEVRKRLFEERALCFRNWVKALVDEYNTQMRMLHLSNTSVFYGYDIEKEGTAFYGINEESLDNIDKVIQEIYGGTGYTVNDLFGMFVDTQWKSDALRNRDIVDTNVFRPSFVKMPENVKLPLQEALVEPAFGTISPMYWNMSIDEFVMNNKVGKYHTFTAYEDKYGTGKVEEKRYASSEQIEERIRRDEFTPYDILIKLSDRRSAQCGAYRKKWIEATDKLAESLVSAVDYIDEKSKDGELSIDAISARANFDIECLNLIDPDMFRYFELDNFDSFVNSYWGRMLLDAISNREKGIDLENDADHRKYDKFRGVLTTMQVQYRLRNLTRYNEQEQAVLGDGIENGTDIQKRLDKIDSKRRREVEILSSCSPAWAAIMSDLTGMPIDENGEGSVWTDVRNDARSDKKLFKFKNAKIEGGNAPFWGSGQDTVHDTLLSFMSDPTIGFQLKMEALSDCTRFNSAMYDISSYEMAGQLMYNPSPMAEGKKFENFQGLSTPLDNIKRSMDKFDRNKEKELDEMADSFRTSFSVKDEEGVYKFSKSEFIAHIDRIRACPEYLYVENYHSFFDMVASVLAPDYANTEKIKQQIATFIAHRIQCIKRNGGFLTHVYEANGKVAGTIGPNQFSEHDVARALCDPEFSVTYYDEFGNTFELSRQSLTGCTTDEELADFLNDNTVSEDERMYRNILMLSLRRKTFVARGTNADNLAVYTNAVPDNQGGKQQTYSNAGSNAYKDTVFNILAERSRFGSVVALLTPGAPETKRTDIDEADKTAKPHTAETYSEELPKTADLLLDYIIYKAQTIDKDMTPEDVLKGSELGSLLRIDFLTMAEQLYEYRDADGNPIKAEDLDRLQKIAITEIAESVNLIRSRLGDLRKIMNYNLSGSKSAQPRLIRECGVDQHSVIIFYDCLQHISGARTGDMINVEGGETKKNEKLNRILQQDPRHIRYVTITTEDLEANSDEVEQLSEALAGQFENGKTLFDKVIESEDGMFVVRLPDDFNNMVQMDMTKSISNGRQLNSVSAWLDMKRHNAAETFNAKTKKHGDDGKNSITKFAKYLENGESKRIRTAVENAPSREAAIEILANELIKYDKKLEYDNAAKYDPSTYYNIASLMVVPRASQGENASKFNIRSIEQLSTAVRFSMPTSLLEIENDKEAGIAVLEWFDYFINNFGMEDYIPWENRHSEEESAEAHELALQKNISDAERLKRSTIMNMRTPNVLSKNRKSFRAYMPANSSAENAFALLTEVTNEYRADKGVDYKFKSRDEINKRSYAAFGGKFKNKEDNRDYEVGDDYKPTKIQKLAISRVAWFDAERDANGRYSFKDWSKRTKADGTVVTNKSLFDKDGNFKNINRLDRKYDFAGMASDPKTLEYAMGPSTIVFMDINDRPADRGFTKTEKNAIDHCRKYGVNMVCLGPRSIPAPFVDDAIIIDTIEIDGIRENVYMIPFWHMKLTGSRSDYVMPGSAQFLATNDMFAMMCESTVYEYGPGDSTANATEDFINRAHINAGDTVENDISSGAPNFINQQKDEEPEVWFQAELISPEEKDELWRMLDEKSNIDIGIIDSNEKTLSTEAMHLNLMIEEYKRRWDETDEHGNLVSNAANGDIPLTRDSIVGWYKVKAYRPSRTQVAVSGGGMYGEKEGEDTERYCYVPIIAFHAKDSGMSPSGYTVDSIAVDKDKNRVSFDWTYNGKITDELIKMFDGDGAANKMIISPQRLDTRYLDNGMALDAMVSSKTVASRNFPKNRRTKSCKAIYLMSHLDRKYAWSVAEHDEFANSWDDRDYIRNGIMTNSLTRDDWREIWNKHKNDVWYEKDEKIDKLVKIWVDRALKMGTVNPTNLLGTKFKMSEDGEWYVPKHHRLVEFEMFAETDMEFIDSYWHFMNRMTTRNSKSTLCPDGLDGDDTNTIYKKGVGEYEGCLLMLVPHKTVDHDGRVVWYKVPEFVYPTLMFFGQDMSGFKRPGLNAADTSPDQLNSAVGKLPWDYFMQIMRYTSIGIGSTTDFEGTQLSTEIIARDARDDTEGHTDSPQVGNVDDDPELNRNIIPEVFDESNLDELGEFEGFANLGIVPDDVKFDDERIKMVSWVAGSTSPSYHDIKDMFTSDNQKGEICSVLGFMNFITSYDVIRNRYDGINGYFSVKYGEEPIDTLMARKDIMQILETRICKAFGGRASILRSERKRELLKKMSETIDKAPMNLFEYDNIAPDIGRLLTKEEYTAFFKEAIAHITNL